MPPKPPPKPSNLISAARLSKRGLGWPWDHPASLFNLFAPHAPDRISWLFNWELWRPDGVPAAVEWVPCIRTAAQVKDLDPFLSDISTKFEVKHLLGFNEPEIPDQANMSVDDAVKLWKESVLLAKEKFGVRLGSPGMSSDASRSIPWLDGFFEKCGGVSESGVDFLVLHWYGTDVEGMKQWLGKMHERYRLPVWINEWACSNMGSGECGGEEVEAFMREGMRWLDGCEWVDRYAYFGLGQGRTVGEWVGRGSNFVEGKEGEERLTKLGRCFCE